MSPNDEPGAAGAVPIVRIDHVYARSADPDAIFNLLTRQLGLPVVWAMADYGGFRSGAVFFGNAAFEVLRFDDDASATIQQAHLLGIAFEPAMPEVRLLDEVRARGLDPSPPHSFQAQGIAWTNINLRSLCKETPPWNTRHVFVCRWHHNEGARRDNARRELLTQKGGALGIIRLEEIVVGTTDLDAETSVWQRLLAPGSSSVGRWDVGTGPAIRLVSAPANGLLSLVVQVGSRAVSGDVLRTLGLLGSTSESGVTILPSSVQGLDVRLV
jgi:glyoxalase-like protein